MNAQRRRLWLRTTEPDSGHLEIPACEMKAGDVYTDRSGTNWIVRNVGTPDEIGVTVRLAAGRSQPASPEVFNPDEIVKVYRP